MAESYRFLPRGVRRFLRNRLIRVEMSPSYRIVAGSAQRLRLEGKTAVVTGASGAIGRAISVQLASEGARVVLVARDRSKLTALSDEIADLGGLARSESVDLGDADAIAELAASLGSVDILVNNAGGSARSQHAPIWEQRLDVLDELISVNLRAPMLTTATFGRMMIAAGLKGRIINIGSTVALGGLSRFSDYAATKLGVVGLTRSTALEFGPHGITVNCVTPGIVLRGQVTQTEIDRALSKGVLPEVGRPEDVSQMVSFLCGPEGRWITGQQFVVDGGRSLGLHGER